MTAKLEEEFFEFCRQKKVNMELPHNTTRKIRWYFICSLY